MQIRARELKKPAVEKPGIEFFDSRFRSHAVFLQSLHNAVAAAPDAVLEIPLNLTAKEHIKTAVSCGDRLCLLIVSDFGEERVIIADPASLQINAVLK